MGRKKVAVIGIVGVPANYGGFETFAEYLSRHISDEFDLTIYCSESGVERKSANFEKAKLKYIPLKATGIQSIPYDIMSILHSLVRSDVLLVLGSSGALILPLLRLLTHKKIIFNMAGLEWKRSKWNKFARAFLKWSEKIAVKYSDITVVDNKGLQEYITEAYGVSSQVIAYGGDQVKKVELSNELAYKYKFLKQSYYTAVARIQPDNNVDMILKAFEKNVSKNLVFIGNWAYSDYGLSLKAKYSNVKNIHLLDPIYNLEILDQIRGNCEGYIHGHSSGGTNPSLVEAMHLQLPIFAYDVNFNRYTTAGEAFYFKNPDELIDVIADSCETDRNVCATKMKYIAEEQYTWMHIVKRYEGLFDSD